MLYLRITDVYPTRQVESATFSVPALPDTVESCEHLFKSVMARPINRYSRFGLVHDHTMSSITHLYRKGGKYYIIVGREFYKLEEYLTLRRLHGENHNLVL
jgi:hypothetical protein